jgi:hypothetical protein
MAEREKIEQILCLAGLLALIDKFPSAVFFLN